MPKIHYIKGNLRRSDYSRAVLTDTAPYEVPLIVSNDGFYKNIEFQDKYNINNSSVIKKLITENAENYTVPYRYLITKDSLSTRKLSLIHPSSQKQIADFYKEYDTLICYFSSISAFSLRHPVKLGSSFFFKTSEMDHNKFKNGRIDTKDIDLFVKNPASFFVYQGFDRLYKFFMSSAFVRLEKKYSRMALLDISKCFSSIYTHSLGWAVKNSDHSKRNTGTSSFSNEFDRLMRGSNHNETSGICIGPETSRIFAEIILQTIDKNIQRDAESEGFFNGRHYECRRYVDDYIIFTKDQNVEKALYRIIEHSLGEFNLHLNEAKFQTYERPFITLKSHIVQATKLRLARLFTSVMELTGPSLLVPKKIMRPSQFIRTFISSIKSGCYEEDVKYDLIANYVISSISKRITRLVGDFSRLDKGIDTGSYVVILKCLMEIIFFFYTVNPTVASSFHLSRCIVGVARFTKENFPSDQRAVCENIQNLINQFARSNESLRRSSNKSKIPIEVLNVLIASTELGDGNFVTENWLMQHVIQSEHLEYFTIVSCLFYIKDGIKYEKLHKVIVNKIKLDMSDMNDIARNSAKCHLFFDVLSCKHLDLKLRVKILSSARKALSLPTLSNSVLEADIAEFVSSPWFVQWDTLDIMNMISKKELSAVY